MSFVFEPTPTVALPVAGQTERFVLQIFWDTLEDHTVGFRESELFTQWRAIVGPFFAAPPQVEHFALTYQSA